MGRKEGDALVYEALDNALNYDEDEEEDTSDDDESDS